VTKASHGYSVISRPVALRKIIDTHIKVSDILGLNVSLKFVDFISQIFLLFVPEMPTSFTPDIV